MSTALVTGAAGFIGSHLVEELIDSGYRVRGLDNLASGDRYNLAGVWQDDSFSFVEGDVRDVETVEQAMHDVEYVFHLAAFISVSGSVEQPAVATDVNCTGTATVLQAARSQDVAGVVLASSTAVYGDDPPVPTEETAPLVPESPYALSKEYGERLASQFDVPTVALRFFNVYGPRQDPGGEYAAVIPAFVERMLDGQRPVIYGDGEQTRDFVYVGDVVEACLRAVEPGFDGLAEGDGSGPHATTHTVINVATGERKSINELAAALNGVLDTSLEPIYDDPRPGDVRHSGADVTRARELLGYEPSVDFEVGLRRTVDYYRRTRE